MSRITFIASAIVVAGLAGGTVAVAGAGTNQSMLYFSLLDDYGIAVIDPAVAVQNAYTICAMFDEGYSMTDVMDGLAYGEKDSDPAYLTDYITAATTVYCAEHR